MVPKVSSLVETFMAVTGMHMPRMFFDNAGPHRMTAHLFRTSKE